MAIHHIRLPLLFLFLLTLTRASYGAVDSGTNAVVVEDGTAASIGDRQVFPLSGSADYCPVLPGSCGSPNGGTVEEGSGGNARTPDVVLVHNGLSGGVYRRSSLASCGDSIRAVEDGASASDLAASLQSVDAVIDDRASAPDHLAVFPLSDGASRAGVGNGASASDLAASLQSVDAVIDDRASAPDHLAVFPLSGGASRAVVGNGASASDLAASLQSVDAMICSEIRLS